MGRRTRPPRHRPLSVLAREDFARASRLRHALLWSSGPLKFSGLDRDFLAELLQRAMLHELGPPPARRNNVLRDRGIALDFHRRLGRHRASEVAKAWKVSTGNVRTIASRYRGECAYWLRNAAEDVDWFIELHRRLSEQKPRNRYRTARRS